MTASTILFVDNDEDFLNTRAEFLEQAGYQVLKAYSIEEANKLLTHPSICLAILDIRATDDDDEHDFSGINLAEHMPRFIPKIIHTGHPTVTAVQQMLRAQPNGLSVAMDFIYKEDGPEALLISVTKIVNLLAIAQSKGRQVNQVIGATRSKDVFVVHGHDDAIKHEVARFIERIGLNPIILSEQTSGNRTIMEQLEKYSQISFAVVLLTPDDVGYPKETKPKKVQFRARQNVIFELGFFIGSLGRSRVRSLYTDGVEILSDYHGVIYIKIDSGGWKGKLARELEDAGFFIDPKKLKNALL
jgi:predicted nucleotide-binding protein